MTTEFMIPVRQEDYNLKATIECGQFFRWNAVSDGYQCYQGDKCCRVYQDSKGLHVIAVTSEDAEQTQQTQRMWTTFFGLSEREQTNLTRFRELMDITPFMRQAFDYSRGLHLLRQEPWECLVSFIVSQRNNIARIKQCVFDICWAAGNPIEAFGDEAYSFPLPSELKPSVLLPCKLGYRDKYIYGAAAHVEKDILRLHELQPANMQLNQAIQHLTFLNGVGHKVASCVALFSLWYEDAWPVDVWIERAMEEGNITYRDVKSFGSYAGIIQEYIYYYILNRQETKVYLPKEQVQ